MTAIFMTDGNFAAGGQVRHGFFGRQGGVSGGLYASLNCGVGTKDRLEDVLQNRMRVAEAMGIPPENLLTAKQIHSADCIAVPEPWAMDSRPEGDAMVTDKAGIALGVLTADCAPVLFYGKKGGGRPVIGAAHAGWGGALKGVLESTVRMMREHGAVVESIRAVIGPCIAQPSYEVGPEFPDPFLEEDPGSGHFFKSGRREGHFMFDLPGYAAGRLARCGVRFVSITGIDTYSAAADYFSYRRATHKGESDYGRQISMIRI